MLLTEEEKKARLSRAFSGHRNVPKKLHRATQALFWEKRHSSRAKQKGFLPIYNLSKRDHDGTLSMPQIYFQCTSEYEAAMVLLGDWEHWEKLVKCTWFQPYLEKWRNEKDRRDNAIGQGKIVELAAAGNLAAAKYLANKNTSKAKTDPDVVEKEPTTQAEDDWASNTLSRLRT